MSVLDNVRFAARRATGKAGWCEHVEKIGAPQPESRDTCPECVAAGDEWKALRVCMSCGHVGCCDSSKNRHARRHAEASAHPVVRSLEPGESWMWCFADRRIVAPRDPTGAEGMPR